MFDEGICERCNGDGDICGVCGKGADACQCPLSEFENNLDQCPECEGSGEDGEPD